VRGAFLIETKARKCEGRKSFKESNPELVKAAKRLYRKPRHGKTAT
jgi:hypothetical protein